MSNVLIFGGGISGLTVAHELVKNDFKVTVIEKDKILGGMAKSRRESNNTPSEHSWRGWGNHYSNLFRIMNEIPYNSNTVYNNLTKKIDFYKFEEDEYSRGNTFTLSDWYIIICDSGKFLLSDDRRKEFYEKNAYNYYQNKLSKKTFDYLFKFVQTAGFGMENKDGSVGHLLQFLMLPVIHPFKYKNCNKNDYDGEYCSNSTSRWHTLNQPTNEGLFNPWKEYLESQGVEFLMETELVGINVDNDKISSVLIQNISTDTINEIESDDYVFALNPYNLETVFKNSIPDSDIYDKFRKMNEKTTSNQISFRIGINKDIEYPEETIGLVFNNASSPYNITFYPQNTHWKEYDEMNIPYKTLWSGTLMDSISNGNVFDKPSINLSKEELKIEIKNQILSSKSFQEMIYSYNGFNIEDKDIDYIEIWYEWSVKNGKLTQDYKKWINNIYNEEYRPLQKTDYINLFLAGAYTKTSISIYSMEGACESGIISSNHILEKYSKKNEQLVVHNDPLWTKPFKVIDNILYHIHLPSIMYIIQIFVLCVILFFLFS